MDPIGVLSRHFGYPRFRTGQEELVRAALAGRDAMGILPTGGGKSVCYQVPAHLLPGLTIVVSPLISLMADQVHRARNAGLTAELLNSTQSADERRRVIREAERGTLKLLLLAPERLETHEFREALHRVRVSLVAVDESHCISEWGHDFRPSYLRIGSLRDHVHAPVMALTATATPRVRDEIARVLRLDDPVRVVGSFDRPNLSWHVVPVRRTQEREALLNRLVRSTTAAVVIYAGTRRVVEVLRDRLAALGLPAEAYHAGLAADERARVQEAFMKGERRIVVATNAFGMGVDKANVRLVVHWQLPGSLEAYYQEAGRAGRDGEPARCVALYTRGDADLQRGFVDRSRPSTRALLRVVRAVRDRIPPGDRGELSVLEMAKALGPDWSSEAVEGALAALVAANALRLLDESAPEGAPDRVLILGVHTGPPNLQRARALRQAALSKLGCVTGFARSKDCRRRTLLTYFGEEEVPPACGACDRCLGRSDPVSAELRAVAPSRPLWSWLLARR